MCLSLSLSACVCVCAAVLFFKDSELYAIIHHLVNGQLNAEEMHGAGSLFRDASQRS